MELEGGCSCGNLRYRLTADPLVVHACHCRDCQRISGSAFVLNIWIEEQFVTLDAGTARSFRLKGGSGSDHEVFFCETCGTHLWSRYHAVPGATLFVRAGTLDDPSRAEPAVHIFVRTRLPWVKLPPNVPSFDAFYDMKAVWPQESLERLRRSIAERRKQQPARSGGGGA
jgi:hypothetical protein